MGSVTCPLSPQIRAINKKNLGLEKILKEHIEGLEHYGFSSAIIEAANTMPTRYMYNEGILEDIQKLHASSLNTSYSKKTQNSSSCFEDDLKNSCLILQNQAADLKDSEDKQNPTEPPDSFVNNLKKNQSLVVQMNILYKQQLKLSDYSSAMHLFLKWANMFQQHSYGGFLKPLYKAFYHNLKQIPMNELDTIVDEVCIFVQYMVSVVTDIYGLKFLAESGKGRLIKNENVYNLIMTFLFKRTKVRSFLEQSIEHNYKDKIAKIQKKMNLLSKKPIDYFGVSSNFTLQHMTMAQSDIDSKSNGGNYQQSFSDSLKLVGELSQSGSPVTELKTIIAISKQIIKDIEKYYSLQKKDIPDLDPDNLSSIVMYLLCRSGNVRIFKELKIVESFTTTNCLNCISGYYLNVFVAALESIETMEIS